MQILKIFVFSMLLAAIEYETSIALAQQDLSGKPNAKLIEQTLFEARQAHLNNKLTPAETKIGRFLRPVMQRHKANVEQQITPLVHTNDKDQVQVYITLNSVSETNLAELKSLGATIEVVNQDLGKVQAWVEIALLDRLATLDDIVKITVPSYGEPSSGRVLTEGDAILGGAALRALGASGSGVKIGIISDGANNWPSAASTGDLPDTITTFGSCATRPDDPQNCRSRLTCNEGTAMAEIVHDIAPEAEIAVAAVSTSLEFIQQINRLATTFQANIIVDDLGFFGEPYFEDGDLANAVSALPSNILYFSSAGNSANIHYEQEFSSINGQHNFGVQNGLFDTSIGFAIRPNRGTFVLMQWADRYETPNSNYDLFIFDQNTEVGRSAGLNNIAIEGVCVFNGSNTDAVRFAVANRVSGSFRRLEFFFLGASAIEYPIPAGSVFGHAGTTRAIAVGAINAGSNDVAFYSSNGPARVNFPSVQLRAKPDIAATDGVSVTGAGGFPSPFFGTSAAAPHAAAVAALLLSAGPDVSPQQVRSVLLGSASGGGTGAEVGRGRINALRAFQQLGIELDSNGLIRNGANRGGLVVPPIMLLLEDEG